MPTPTTHQFLTKLTTNLIGLKYLLHRGDRYFISQKAIASFVSINSEAISTELYRLVS
ncbi:MAG: hypothetical protein MGU50_13195 [Trichodesmium sp. MAG_R02]|nr:hypothetical protein [Trichodesmium sp. MAG_R02]